MVTKFSFLCLVLYLNYGSGNIENADYIDNDLMAEESGHAVAYSFGYNYQTPYYFMAPHPLPVANIFSAPSCDHPHPHPYQYHNPYQHRLHRPHHHHAPHGFPSTEVFDSAEEMPNEADTSIISESSSVTPSILIESTTSAPLPPPETTTAKITTPTAAAITTTTTTANVQEAAPTLPAAAAELPAPSLTTTPTEEPFLAIDLRFGGTA